MLRTRFKSDRGTGVGEVMVYMIGFSIVCFVFYFVTGWIYETKQEKVDNRIDYANWKLQSKQQRQQRARGPAGYMAYCSGIFEKKCKV